MLCPLDVFLGRRRDLVRRLLVGLACGLGLLHVPQRHVKALLGLLYLPQKDVPVQRVHGVVRLVLVAGQIVLQLLDVPCKIILPDDPAGHGLGGPQCVDKARSRALQSAGDGVAQTVKFRGRLRDGFHIGLCPHRVRVISQGLTGAFQFESRHTSASFTVSLQYHTG